MSVECLNLTGDGLQNFDESLLSTLDPILGVVNFVKALIHTIGHLFDVLKVVFERCLMLPNITLDFHDVHEDFGELPHLWLIGCGQLHLTADLLRLDNLFAESRRLLAAH